MSIAVPDKFLFKHFYEKGNLYLQTGCLCYLLEIFSWITNDLFMKDLSKLPFLSRRRQGITRQNSDLKDSKLKKKFLALKKLFNYFILSLYL
jgi:hypothetical protein